LEPYLSSHFPIKALDILQNFLEIEVVCGLRKVFLCLNGNTILIYLIYWKKYLC